MRTSIFLIVLTLLISLNLKGQGVSISGKVFDSTNQPLIGANIVLLDANENIKYQASTDIEGTYKLEEVIQGKYRIRISYLGFFSYYKELEVAQKDIEYGNITLVESPVDLDEIVVEGKVPLAVQKGDTTSYNASNYKTLKDASTEDLIAKMPGVVVQNGTVQAQGESVQQILVDGKPFFGENTSAALKNLPAEVVDRIEVFDQKSEQSEFTGFDDGQTTKTINIITKVDKRAGSFGKAYVAYGSEQHYNLGGNFSIVNGDQRISFIGQSNDINIQNFSSEDILGVSGSSGGGGGGRGGFGRNNDFSVPQQGGISATNAAGINFSDAWGESTELSASYFFNRTNNVYLSSIERLFFESNAGESGERYAEESESNSINMNHRISARFEHKFNDKTSINLRPRFSFQNNDGFSSTFGATSFEDLNINQSDNTFEAIRRGLNFNNNALLRHKIGKSRRTISLNLSTGYNNTVATSNLYSFNEYFAPILVEDLLDQNATLDEVGWNNSMNVTYTEPVSKKGMLSVEYRINLENEDANKETYSADESGLYNNLERALSSVFQNDYITHTGGLSYNHRVGKSVIMTRASLQYASLSTNQDLPFAADIDRTFLNVIPFVMWRYSIDRQNNLRVIYRTNTRKPTLTQLQEVVDNSNPLQLKVGNPALDQQFQHSIFARLSRSNTEKGRVLFALIGGNITQNYIGTSLYNSRSTNELVTKLNLQPGSQVSQNVNLNGYWDFRTFVTLGMPVGFIKSNINFNLSGNFANTPGLINDELNNAQRSTYGLGVVISSNISEKIDFSIGSNSSFNDVNNSLNKAQNSNFFNQRSTLTMNWILPADLVFRTDVNNEFFTGLSDGFNQNFWIWNMAFGKKVLKSGLGEINISVYDLLNQNLRITREVTGNYIQDSRTNVLQRYVMVNFIYNFRNFKTGKEEPKREQNNEMRGGWNGF